MSTSAVSGRTEATDEIVLEALRLRMAGLSYEAVSNLLIGIFGKRFTAATVRSAVESMCEKEGIQNPSFLRPHQARKSFKPGFVLRPLEDYAALSGEGESALLREGVVMVLRSRGVTFDQSWLDAEGIRVQQPAYLGLLD